MAKNTSSSDSQSLGRKIRAGETSTIVERVVRRGAPPIVKARRPMGHRTRSRKSELEVEAHGVERKQLDEGESEEAAVVASDALEEAAPEEVAELESAVFAEGLEGAAEEEGRRVSREEPSNFLAMYFQEMAELDVLRPDEEFVQARRIEGLEISLWDQVFAYAPIVEHVLQVVERIIENSLTEFHPLRKVLGGYRKAPTKTNERRLARQAHCVSEKLRAIDIDRRIFDVVLAEIGTIARGEVGRVVVDRLPFNSRSASFRHAYEGIVRTWTEVQSAKNDFVKANLRLVVSIARRFNHGRMPLADLIQEGNIGLIKAVERFDYRRGYRFSTYASWWIRHAISRALADKGRAVRLPVHMIDAYHRVAKSKRELVGKLGRQPTAEEIGGATGIAPAKIEKMRSYLLDQSFSLDRPVSDEDGRRFIDFVQDPNAEMVSPVDVLADHAMTDEVREMLHGLKPIEADILRQRFGLDDDHELTLKEIGDKYNLSRERIRQLQEQALIKMRRALQRKDLM
ncbi:MAG: sigma-70 family RNA polymerase sigma factor [Pseudomonadota bacterium]